jgi:hypothetical protein
MQPMPKPMAQRPGQEKRDELAEARLQLQRDKFEYQQAKDQDTKSQIQQRIQQGQKRIDVLAGAKRIEYEMNLQKLRKQAREMVEKGVPTGENDLDTGEPEMREATQAEIDTITKQMAEIQVQLDALGPAKKKPTAKPVKIGGEGGGGGQPAGQPVASVASYEADPKLAPKIKQMRDQGWNDEMILKYLTPERIQVFRGR